MKEVLKMVVFFIVVFIVSFYLFEQIDFAPEPKGVLQTMKEFNLKLDTLNAALDSLNNSFIQLRKSCK